MMVAASHERTNSKEVDMKPGRSVLPVLILFCLQFAHSQEAAKMVKPGFYVMRAFLKLRS